MMRRSTESRRKEHQHLASTCSNACSAGSVETGATTKEVFMRKVVRLASPSGAKSTPFQLSADTSGKPQTKLPDRNIFPRASFCSKTLRRTFSEVAGPYL